MKKILSVDDSAIMRKIIRGAIEAIQHEFIEADNGEKAIELMQANPDDIALVLLDWNMPVKDGFTTLTEIQDQDAIKHIPVIMVTTEAERANSVKALKAGAKQYITKPFTQDELIM